MKFLYNYLWNYYLIAKIRSEVENLDYSQEGFSYLFIKQLSHIKEYTLKKITIKKQYF